ncbi:hypothetical protein [Acidovorax sp. Root217]|uniref:hypothetical protein n=1 Tax=Acidovorax sp. Root217 TaxID=1736492 RepID=UPI0012F89EFA|nr:hypothetical protein [Acidovorax sp. Root217]
MQMLVREGGSTSVSQQFFDYSIAYLNAAKVLNARALEIEIKWADATVVLWNACHAVELFLKATILLKEPSIKHSKLQDHNIARLAQRHRLLYDQKRFHWEIPFMVTTESMIGANGYSIKLSEEDRKRIEGRIPFSIEHRYPVDREGKPWDGLQGMSPAGFAQALDRLHNDFNRIWNAGQP